MITVLLLTPIAYSSVLYDDFDDNILGSEWDVGFNEYCDGWAYNESGTSLKVTDVSSNTMNQWARVALSQGVSTLDDFGLECRLSWDSEVEKTAMQQLSIYMLDIEGNVVSGFGYSDAWKASPGSIYAELSNVGIFTTRGTNSEENQAFPLTSSAHFAVSREDGNVSIIWNGNEVLAGYNDTLIKEVAIQFSFYHYKSGVKSFFGNESVDLITVVPEPASISILALGTLSMLRRRKR